MSQIKEKFSFKNLWEKIKKGFAVSVGVLASTATIIAIAILTQSDVKGLKIDFDDSTSVFVPYDSLYSWYDSLGVNSLDSMYQVDSAGVANLIKYQQAYQATAQVISVASTLFDTLLGAVRR